MRTSQVRLSRTACAGKRRCQIWSEKNGSAEQPFGCQAAKKIAIRPVLPDREGSKRIREACCLRDLLCSSPAPKNSRPDQNKKFAPVGLAKTPAAITICSTVSQFSRRPVVVLAPRSDRSQFFRSKTGEAGTFRKPEFVLVGFAKSPTALAICSAVAQFTRVGLRTLVAICSAASQFARVGSAALVAICSAVSQFVPAGLANSRASALQSRSSSLQASRCLLTS